ncbi:MAG: AMP-dependent synthetase/ligase [Candidatus Aminicenantaceae bacterium]
MVKTINQLFLNTVKSYKKDDLMMYKKEGNYIPISTESLEKRVKNFSLGLKDLGLKPADKLIILSENRPEWVMTDISNIIMGGITVPIYTSLISEQIRYIVDDSDARFVVFSDMEQWEKIKVIKNSLKKVFHYITFLSKAPAGALTFDQIMKRGEKIANKEPDIFKRIVESAKPDDVVSIIYTSGTTGIPKGVVLTHNNFMSNIKSTTTIIEFTEKDTVLSFLPLSHVLERMVMFTYFYKGSSIAFAESIETVAENLLEIRPHIMVSVPRVFEKIYAKIMDNILSSSSMKRKIFFWALKTGKEYGNKQLLQQKIPFLLKIKRKIAHKLVFSKILEKTGGRVRFFISGGAPLSRDIAEFFYAIGLLVLEGYGLTETSPVIAVNTMENIKFGTVGKPIPGVQVKIEKDGEILVKGPNVMKEYYKKEEETKEVFRDGWFCTGDIGYLDEDGFLVITDRKKDIIVTAGGKNIAPQSIENLLKTSSYIANAIVLGDKRRFISALIVPNFEKLEEYAKKKNILYSSNRDLIKNDKIVHFINQEIENLTTGLAMYERIRKICLLERDFEIEKGEITPTLKIRRNAIEKKYKKEIEELYKEIQNQ